MAERKAPKLSCNLCTWPEVEFTQEGSEALVDHLATEHLMMECAEPHKADTVRRMLRGVIVSQPTQSTTLPTLFDQRLDKVRSQVREIKEDLGWMDQRDHVEAIEVMVRQQMALCEQVGMLARLVGDLAKVVTHG